MTEEKNSGQSQFAEALAEAKKVALDEAVAEAEREVITINRAQFIEAVADAVTDEPLAEIISKNPMLIMLFAVMQRMLWEKCVELTKSTDKKGEKEDVDGGQIRSE